MWKEWQLEEEEAFDCKEGERGGQDFVGNGTKLTEEEGNEEGEGEGEVGKGEEGEEEEEEDEE